MKWYFVILICISLVGKECICNAGDPSSIPGSGRSPGEGIGMGFPGGSDSKESACNAGDLGSIPGLGRSPGEGKGYPLQDSDLENSMDYIIHGVTKSWTRLSDFHFTFTRIVNEMFRSVQFSCSVLSDSLQPHGLQTPGLPVHHQLSELTQTHVHSVSDAIQPSHPLSSPSPPTFNLSQRQSLFQ